MGSALRSHTSGTVDIPNAWCTLWRRPRPFKFDITERHGPTHFIDYGIDLPIALIRAAGSVLVTLFVSMRGVQRSRADGIGVTLEFSRTGVLAHEYDCPEAFTAQPNTTARLRDCPVRKLQMCIAVVRPVWRGPRWQYRQRHCQATNVQRSYNKPWLEYHDSKRHPKARQSPAKWSN